MKGLRIVFRGFVVAMGLCMGAGAYASINVTENKLITPLNTTIFPQASGQASSLEIMVNHSAGYLPTLAVGSSMYLSMIVPPGVSYVVISGESNEWLGAAGKQPIMATVPPGQTFSGVCPSLVNGVYTCDNISLSPVSGGLSQTVYNGDPLQAAQYAGFVLVNAGDRAFTLKTLAVGMIVEDLAAYNTWWNARNWNDPNDHGIGVEVPKTPQGPQMPDCLSGLPTIGGGSELPITIPKLDSAALGLPSLAPYLNVKLVHQGGLSWKLISYDACK